MNEPGLEKELQDLKRRRKLLENILDQTTIGNKKKVNCIGTSKSKVCAFGEFQFFTPEVAREISKKGYRCKKCWKIVIAQEKRNTVTIAGPTGPSARWTQHQQFLQDNTFEVFEHPTGQLIYLGYDRQPLEKKWNEWWELRKYTQVNLPSGYLWCLRHSFPWKKIKKECHSCSYKSKCDLYKLHDAESNLSELRKKLQVIEKPDKMKKKVDKETRRMAKERKEVQLKQAFEQILKKY